MIFSQQQ